MSELHGKKLMVIQGTNIQQKLYKVRSRQLSEVELLQEVAHILKHHQLKEETTTPMSNLTKATHSNTFDLDLLEAHRIYHLEHIKKVCIDYRLRFLDLRFFKGDIPRSAKNEIRKLESEHNTTLNDLKIMAPSKLFKLKDKDDPLLFAPMGNNYFYLVHQWGNDLHPLRKLLVWPFKGMVNLVLFTLLLSYLVTLMVPEGLFSKNNSTAEFWIIFFFMFKWMAAVVIFYGFALGKNFNPAIWNSKYFNA